MAVSLDMFMQGMEHLDIRDFRRKKIWHGFEYYKSDRKNGVNISIIVGYSDYVDEFVVETVGASIYFNSIEKFRNPLLNKYDLLKSKTTFTISHSFETGIGLKISFPEHIDMFVSDFQRLLENEIFPFVERYSDIEEVANEISSHEYRDLPFDFARIVPITTAMLILKQTVNPCYEDQLQIASEKMKRRVLDIMKDPDYDSRLADVLIRELKMFEELFYDDLLKIDYNFFHHDFN